MDIQSYSKMKSEEGTKLYFIKRTETKASKEMYPIIRKISINISKNYLNKNNKPTIFKITKN